MSSKNPSVRHEEVNSCQEPSVVTVRSLAGPNFLAHFKCYMFENNFRFYMRDVASCLIVHKKKVSEMPMLLKGNTLSIPLQGYKCIEIFVVTREHCSYKAIKLQNVSIHFIMCIYLFATYTLLFIHSHVH